MRRELFTQDSRKVKIEESTDNLLIKGHPRKALARILWIAILTFSAIYLPYLLIPLLAPRKILSADAGYFLYIPPVVTALLTLIFIWHKEHYKYFSCLSLDVKTKEITAVWEGTFSNRQETLKFDDVDGFQHTYTPPAGKHGEHWWLEIKLKDSRVIPLVYVWEEEHAFEAITTANNFLKQHT